MERSIILRRMYHLLERMDECAVNGDLYEIRKLNRYFSELDHNEFVLKDRDELGNNFDLSRNNYLMSLQKDRNGNYFMKDESLEDARGYLFKIEKQLLDEGIKLRKTLKNTVEK